jgi:hypothetical protein
MTWFKVDDGLHAHRKAVRAGVPAMGLWVLAGSWSANQLTDGWVPDYIAARLDPAYKAHAASLVAAGLWVAGEHDGDSGWWFHQWAEQQPSREQVLTDRAAAAERQRRARERAKERREAERNNSPSHNGSHGVTTAVSHAQVTPVVTVPPTRPDPTRPVVPTELRKEGSLRSQSTDTKPPVVDPNFTRFWDAYPRKVDKGHARNAWVKAVKTTDPEVIISGAARYRDDPRREDRFTAHAATWLNGERWDDQPTTDRRIEGDAIGGAFWDN